MKYSEENKIIIQFIRGDRDSFSWIYNKYVRELFSYGSGLGYNQEILKDAIQEIFLKILSRPELLKDVHNVKYFLFRSLKNSLLNTSRSLSRKENIDDHPYVFVNRITVHDELVEEEDRKLIQDKIESYFNQLSIRQREAIYLRYIQGLNYEEIANLMNMQIPSVRNLIARGISKIRDNTVLSIFFIYCISHTSSIRPLI